MLNHCKPPSTRTGGLEILVKVRHQSQILVLLDIILIGIICQSKEATLSADVTSFLTTAFTKHVSKDVQWPNLMNKYPRIKNREMLAAFTMQTGTKEYIKD